MINTTPGKVYKIVISVVDLDGLGEEEIQTLIENVRYPNHAINPHVMSIESTDIEWHDDHPLNLLSQQKIEFRRLFTE